MLTTVEHHLGALGQGVHACLNSVKGFLVRERDARVPPSVGMSVLGREESRSEDERTSSSSNRASSACTSECLVISM